MAKTKANSHDEKMRFEKYVKRYGQTLNRYKLAYYSGQYRGTMKTKADWDKVLGSLCDNGSKEK